MVGVSGGGGCSPKGKNLLETTEDIIIIVNLVVSPSFSKPPQLIHTEERVDFYTEILGRRK